MTRYLIAAKEAIDTLHILGGVAQSEQYGVEIVNLATSFRQSDVMEEAMAKEIEVLQT